MARDDHAFRRPGRGRAHLRRRRAVFASSSSKSADSKAPGGDWTRILPVVRDAGLYRSEAEVRLSSQNTYTLELTPEGRGDPGL